MTRESQAQRDARRKAARASVASRRRTAAEREAAKVRRAEERTPGHHPTCRCEKCEATR